MTFYLLLTVATGIMIFLQWLTWKKSKSILLPLSTVILYYWSVLGGWFITYDQLNNNGSVKLGVHYYDYLEKLFPVELNQDYFTALIYLCLFVIVFQATVLLLIKKKVRPDKEEPPVKISHHQLIAISLISVVLSFFFIYQQMLEATRSHESFYIFISKHAGKYYSLYQLFKNCSLLTAFGGLVIFLNGKDTRFLAGNRIKGGVFVYLLLMLAVMCYCLILGSRHDLVVAGLFSLILYIRNGKRKRISDLLIIAAALILPVFLIEMTRGIPILDYLGLHLGGASGEEVKLQLSGRQALISILLSNEIFAGHMSMYGAIHYHVPITHGTSFINLASSFIPRFIQPDRPPDIYEHYISVAKNPGIQGFSINHATGWYLNFGIAGVVAGGMALGILLAFTRNFFYHLRTLHTRFFYFLKALAFPSLISFLPVFIRTGPEGYKGLLLEGILIPVFLFWLAGMRMTNRSADDFASV